MLDVCHRQLLWQPRDKAEQEGTWGSGPTKGRVGRSRCELILSSYRAAHHHRATGGNQSPPATLSFRTLGSSDSTELWVSRSKSRLLLWRSTITPHRLALPPCLSSWSFRHFSLEASLSPWAMAAPAHSCLKTLRSCLPAHRANCFLQKSPGSATVLFRLSSQFFHPLPLL